MTRTNVRSDGPIISLAWLCIAAAIVIGLGWAFASAETAKQASSLTSDVTIEGIQSQRDAIAQRADLSEQSRQDITTLLDAARESLRLAAAFAEDTQRFERLRLSAASELEVAKSEAAQPTDVAVVADSNATIEQLRQLRDQAEANLALAQTKVKELEDEQIRRTARKAEIPALTAKAQQELDEVGRTVAALDNQAQTDDPPELVAARRTDLLARRQKLTAQITAMGRELAAYEVRAELVQIQRDQAARRITSLEKAARDWREIVSRKENQLAAEEAAKARLAVEENQPGVKAIAQKNVELIERLSGSPTTGAGLLARRAAVDNQLDDLAKSLRSLQERYEREKQASRASGFADVIDVRLRRIRAALPDIKAHRAAMSARRAELTEIQQALADLHYERDSTPDAESRKQAVLNTLDRSTPPAMREDISRRLDELIKKQEDVYDQLIEAYNDYADRLLRLQEQEGRLVALADRFRSWIDERILWIRSMPAMQFKYISKPFESARSLFQPDLWGQAAVSLYQDARANAEIFGVWIIVFLVLFIVKRRAAGRLKTIAGLVPQVYSDRFAYTIQALMISSVLAFFWPAVLWFVGWRLNAHGAELDFNKTIAAGLNRAGTILVTLQFHRQLCKPNGLGEAHFHWRDSTLRLMRVNLLWLTFVATPLAFIVAAVEANSNDPGSGALGQLAFIAAMLAVAAFARRTIDPKHGILDSVINRERNGWLYRMRRVLHAAIVGLPLALALTAALGYYYTALQLERQLVSTFWLIQALILFNGLVLRWLMLTRRRLVMDDARKRRSLASTVDGGEAGTAADATVTLEEPKIGLDAIDAQTRRLLRTTITFALVLGVWLTWIDMLPTLGILKRVEVFPNFGKIVATLDDNDTATGDVQPASGSTTPSSGSSATPVQLPVGAPIMEPVSLSGDGTVRSDAPVKQGRPSVMLSDLIVAILIVIATIGLSKNLPGLLEITILPQMPLEPSGRFAVATIARYVVSIFGMLLAFSAIGVGWSQVQWLAAAITLGIGFGLQEIVANFISGIILLFEQPIRVGDTVTIEGVDGTVTRIRMRATTITDYDRREIIIPNKDLITGQIINWTLSDSIHRLIFNIGVAYGSDTKLVEKTLLSIATAHPQVMRDPQPQVVFSKFSDSSLEFSLRAFIASLDHLLIVRHELNLAINDAFRKAGIEIAYPQRDIHLRTVPAELTELPITGSTKG